MAHFEWSDELKTTVEMVETSHEYCFFEGTFQEDPESSILITGCQDEVKNIQIQSVVFGDTLGIDYFLHKVCIVHHSGKY